MLINKRCNNQMNIWVKINFFIVQPFYNWITQVLCTEREISMKELTDHLEKCQVSEGAESPQAALLLLARHCSNHPAWASPSILREVRLPADVSDCSLVIDLDAKGNWYDFLLAVKACLWLLGKSNSDSSC